MNKTATRKQEELTRLGFLGLIPFGTAAILIWFVPLVAPKSTFPLMLHSMALAYGGVIASYMAGIGAGGLLAGPPKTDEAFLPGMIAALVAWLAIWTNMPFGIVIPGAWRHAMVLLVLIYLLLRDLRAVEAGNLPSWYGALRMRLTFWASVSILAIMSRLILWGHV